MPQKTPFNSSDNAEKEHWPYFHYTLCFLGRFLRGKYHEDSGWAARTVGFETVADQMVERLELEGGVEISWGGTCRTVKILTGKVCRRKMSKD